MESYPFSKCYKCGKLISEETWFDHDGLCEDCALEEDIEKYG